MDVRYVILALKENSVLIRLESLSSLTLTRTYEWLIDGLTRLILTLI